MKGGGASLKVRRGPAFFNPLYPTAMPAWKTGRGVFGYEGYHYRGITTFLSPPRPEGIAVRTTYYFQDKVRGGDSRCYSALLIDGIVNDGIVVYLNNVEILRSNMPRGRINSTTRALTYLNRDVTWTVHVPIVHLQV